MARKLLDKMKRDAQTPAVDTSQWVLPRKEAATQRAAQAETDKEIDELRAAERAKRAVARSE